MRLSIKRLIIVIFFYFMIGDDSFARGQTLNLNIYIDEELMVHPDFKLLVYDSLDTAFFDNSVDIGVLESKFKGTVGMTFVVAGDSATFSEILIDSFCYHRKLIW